MRLKRICSCLRLAMLGLHVTLISILWHSTINYKFLSFLLLLCYDPQCPMKTHLMIVATHFKLFISSEFNEDVKLNIVLIRFGHDIVSI